MFILFQFFIGKEQFNNEKIKFSIGKKLGIVNSSLVNKTLVCSIISVWDKIINLVLNNLLIYYKILS